LFRDGYKRTSIFPPFVIANLRRCAEGDKHYRDNKKSSSFYSMRNRTIKIWQMKTRLILLVLITVGIASVFTLSAHADSKPKLHVAGRTEFPPFEFIGENQQYRGFSIDLIKLLAVEMGATLKFHRLGGEGREKSLSNGNIDLILGKIKTPEDVDKYDYCDRAVRMDTAIFVRNDRASITCLKDMKGRTVIVDKDFATANLLNNLKESNLLYIESQLAGLELLESGKADALISPSRVVTNYIVQKEGLKNIKEVGVPIESQFYTIAVRKGNTVLLSRLNSAFETIANNGEYDKIYRKWFGEPIKGTVLKNILIIFVGISLIGFSVTLVVYLWNLSLKRRVALQHKEIIASEKRHRDLIENAPEMIHVISREGLILQVNGLELKLLGYSLEEITAITIQDLLPYDCRQEMELFLKSLFEKGSGKLETTFLTKKGEKIDVEVNATSILDSDNTVTGARFFSQDIRERKELEHQLIQSERMAIIGEMAAGFAHEINNPLAIIVGNIDELLRNRSSSDIEYEYLLSIKHNAFRSSKFLHDMVTFAKPAPIHLEPLVIEDLLDESLFLLKQDIKRSCIQVEKDFSPRTPQIWGDKIQIQQIFVNLIINSIQAMTNGGSIMINVHPCCTGGKPMVLIEIADTGKGIPDKDLNKIFDPFFTMRKPRGLGLGLSISKRIIDKHNGTINVQSETQKGTRVILEFPAVVQGEKEIAHLE